MLRRLVRRMALTRKRSGFHSRFGGLWTDRLDARERLARRRDSGEIGDEDSRLLESWMRDGMAILPGAVRPELIDRVRADIEEAWAGKVPAQVELGGTYAEAGPDSRVRHTKLLDLHVLSAAAREAVFTGPLRHFLELLFEDEALAFQSLAFDTGSAQPPHQDTAYVVVTPPLEFAASWIALEDVEAGSGELVYYPGSHRLAEHLFGPGVRNWNRERDGDGANETFLRGLIERCDEAGIRATTFLPKKGDVLLWANDLVHGGSPITRPEATRRSLVTHYCPASAEPYYSAYRPKQGRRLRVGDGAWISSSYYDVSTASTPPLRD